MVENKAREKVSGAVIQVPLSFCPLFLWPSQRVQCVIQFHACRHCNFLGNCLPLCVSNVSLVVFIAFNDSADIIMTKCNGVIMNTLAIEPVLPTSEDMQIAQESSRRLAPLVAQSLLTVKVQVAAADTGEGQKIQLPASAFSLLLRILTEMGQGNAVTLMPIHAQLTTQQAAELLGVSRPFLIKELENKHIPYQMVGPHRRIAYRDLMAYKKQCRVNHSRAMDELVQQAQDIKMGY